jgi:prevent-host-death family protein
VTDVSIRDLRNHGGEVVDRVARGEVVRITRSGRPVAELRPLPRPGVTAEALVEEARRLPPMDPDTLRHDIDALIDPTL